MTDMSNDLTDVKDRIKGIRTVMVTTPDEHDRLSSRPMTVQQVDDDGDVWFLVGRDTDWLPVGTAPANIAFTDSDTWVSFTGELETVPAAVERLWDEVSATWFPDGQAGATALRLHTDEIEWWASPGKLRTLVSVAAAKVKGDAPDAGDSGKIEL